MSLKKFIDIAANLTDSMYQGIYNGSQKHESDLNKVLERSWSSGLDKILITGTSLKGSEEAIEIAKSDDRLYSTVGCHPTHCNEFESDPYYLESLSKLAINPKVVAFGECGLDYDRLHFCKKETQLKYFEQQLELGKSLDLPFFLHCRNSFDDFLSIIERNGPIKGVVHSFDGTIEHAKSLINLGLYIGINGCSLKTSENLAVVKDIPSDRIMLETDCPWCEVRPSHAGFKHIVTKFDAVKKEKWKETSMVKSRNEPITIIQILEILAAVRNENCDQLCEQVYNNTTKLFF